MFDGNYFGYDYFGSFWRESDMPSLGDEFTTVLAAQANIDADNMTIATAQAKLATDQTSFAVAAAHFGQDITAAAVAGVLAPTPNSDGTLPVAITDSTAPNGYRIVMVAPPTTPIPGTTPPAPGPGP